MDFGWLESGKESDDDMDFGLFFNSSTDAPLEVALTVTAEDPLKNLFELM